MNASNLDALIGQVGRATASRLSKRLWQDIVEAMLAGVMENEEKRLPFISPVVKDGKETGFAWVMINDAAAFAHVDMMPVNPSFFRYMIEERGAFDAKIRSLDARHEYRFSGDDDETEIDGKYISLRVLKATDEKLDLPFVYVSRRVLSYIARPYNCLYAVTDNPKDPILVFDYAQRSLFFVMRPIIKGDKATILQ